MTPRELAHVLRLFGGDETPPTRHTLHALMQMFPDAEEGPAR